MPAKLLRQFFLDESYSDRLENMFFIHLRNLSFQLIRLICLASIALIIVSYWFHFIEGDEIYQYLKWQLITGLFLAWIALGAHHSTVVRRFPNFFSFIVFGAVSFFTGYLLAPIKDPSGGMQALIYFIPLYTIITPTNLRKRAVMTLGCFLAIPGAMITGAWTVEIMRTVSFLMVCMGSLSILVGHGTFYKLNRENFFNQRQLAIQQQRIQQLAKYDQLTGLTERHVFEETLREEVASLERDDHSMTLLMIDLDHFKTINDKYGHQAGDRVLERFGTILSSREQGVLRENDKSCRFGGEEFCVLLQDTTKSNSKSLAERIRKRLMKVEFSLENGKTFQATCSIGVAEYKPSMENHEDLVSEADEKLYQAKESGRNQVVL